MKKLYIVSPHSDDAALSLPLTTKWILESGTKITIISCFTLSNWAPRSRNASSIESVTRTRRLEDIEYAKCLGQRVEVVSLNLRDAPLRRDWKISFDGSEIRPSNPTVFQESVSELRRRLRTWMPDHEAAWIFPIGLGHRDHLIVRDVSFDFIDTHPIGLYEEIPYALDFEDDEIERKIRARPDSDQLQRLHQEIKIPSEIWLRSVMSYKSQFSEMEIFDLYDRLKKKQKEGIWTNKSFRAWLRSLEL